MYVSKMDDSPKLVDEIRSLISKEDINNNIIELLSFDLHIRGSSKRVNITSTVRELMKNLENCLYGKQDQLSIIEFKNLMVSADVGFLKIVMEDGDEPNKEWEISQAIWNTEPYNLIWRLRHIRPEANKPITPKKLGEGDRMMAFFFGKA